MYIVLNTETEASAYVLARDVKCREGRQWTIRMCQMILPLGP
jgi:hypothetical protein